MKPSTFETWLIGRDASHGVRFTYAETNRREEGDADAVFGLVWTDDESQRRMIALGTSTPRWARGE